MITISKAYQKYTSEILDCIENFTKKGAVFVKGSRNTIKLFTIDHTIVNIKSFKKPNLINKIAYRYFRKSKARRSFEFASKLIEMQIEHHNP